MLEFKVAMSLRNKMRVSQPVARVLAMAYYGLDLYAGCHPYKREARTQTIQKAFVMGGLDDQNRLTGIGLKMLTAYASRQTVVAKVQ